MPGGGPYRRAWVLARLHTQPFGICEAPLPAAGLTPDQLGTVLWRNLGPAIAARFAGAGHEPPSALTGDGLTADPGTWPFARRRAAVLAERAADQRRGLYSRPARPAGDVPGPS